MNKNEFITNVLAFLNEKRGPSEQVSAQANDNLWENGLINSFKMVELIVYLEEFIGREIPLDSIEIEYFDSIDSMYKFLVEEYKN